ncbi:TRAP transporter small permease [Winogradskyella sp.]|uniref:TRAP transporter small permease n=1 Tax=Winogradskyella sp. TaxID=1883156 RepID=UPI003BAD3653
MRKSIDAFLERLLILVILVMLMAVAWQVISRYVLGAPSTFTDEIASYALIWLGLFGAAYATGKELHLAIDLIPKSTLAKSPRFFLGFVTVSVIVFAVLVMVVGGIRLCWLTWVLDQKSAVLKIPLAFVYLVLPVSGILMVYYSFDSYRQKTKMM